MGGSLTYVMQVSKTMRWGRESYASIIKTEAGSIQLSAQKSPSGSIIITAMTCDENGQLKALETRLPEEWKLIFGLKNPEEECFNSFKTLFESQELQNRESEKRSINQ